MANVELHPEASQDYFDAMQWYIERSPTLGREFQKEFDAAVDRIQQAPERWPHTARNTRRVQMHRFPYLIYYRLSVETIRIVAVAHCKRRPSYWHNRR